MKHSRNAKPSANQRSISAFFTPVSSSTTGDAVKRSHETHSLSSSSAHSSGIHSKPCVFSKDSPPIPKREISSIHRKKSNSPSGLSEVSSPSNKRKREVSHPDSPDIIPGTPPTSRGRTDKPKTSKRLSLNPHNSNQKTSAGLKGIVSNESSSTKTVASEKESQRRKSSSPPRKALYDLSHLTSPPKSKVSSQKTSCDINATSKKLVISPIKTEDDDVLKSILKHISPLKPVANVPALRNKFSNCKKSSLFSFVDGSDAVSKGHIANEKPKEVSSASASRKTPTPRDTFKDETPSKKVVLSEKGTPEFPAKKTPRKCSPTKSTSDMSELKYPALNVRPIILKPKTNESNAVGMNSPSLKQAGSITSPSKVTDSKTSPVRRSPRKHAPPSVSTQDKKRAVEIKSAVHQESSAEFEVTDKENSTTPTPLRRSPRKHSTAAGQGKQLKSPSGTEKKENVSNGNTAQPEASCNKKLYEVDDIHAVFQDDYDDVLSYMANMNEDELNTLDLHEAQLCEVVSIVVKIPYKEAILNVKSVEKQASASCRVCGCWLACPVSEGDCVSLQAVSINGEWLLDNTQGFLVLHPDTLISGTTVVGSLFCARRSVLSNLFRGLDSDSPVMVIGSLVHELFQMVLQQRKRTEAEVKQLSDQLISSRHCAQMLYGASMTVAQMQKELLNFVPRIVDFVSRYVDSFKPAGKDKNSVWLGAPSSSFGTSVAHKSKKGGSQPNGWNGKIIGIRDIEETLWEPKLGIKGMVDVSVEVKDMHGNKKVMPLELKTGRASFSAEHRGQVTLYTMMMSRMGQAIDSGLLLYLREGQMQEISVSHNERKDLIQLRNNLAHFVKPRVPVIDEASGQFVPTKLPEPISFKSACEKCPYVTLCSVYLMKDGLSDISGDHPMVSISSSSTQHLTQSHIDYVLHWVGLLLLEDADQLRSSNLKHIWRASPEDREKGRQAIVNLRLLKPGVENSGKYHHTFTRKSSGTLSNDLRDAGLSTGDYILISTDKRIAIERGNIIDIDTSSVKVSTNRNLHDRYANETFHLDTSESNTVLVFNLTNIGCLLDNNESADRLRKIVVDRTVPSFSTTFDKKVIQDCLQIFKRLNKNQRDALLRTLKADSHLLIKGLPGTGKTATMVALVELLVRAGLSVLVTSHTHSAVDNLLLRLKKAGLKFLRLGPDSRIHPQLIPFSESSLTKHCKTPEDLHKVYCQQQIVGVTCLGAGHAGLSQRPLFDVCLVDESTQVLQPSIFRPLFCSRRFVLVGDPEQLPPVVKCHQAQTLGLSESLFARLDSDAATVSLTLNYRMNQVITDLANGLTYEGKLKCGNEKVAGATLPVTSTNQVCDKVWLSASLSADIEKSVVFVDTVGADEKYREDNSSNMKGHRESSSNRFELALVMKLLDAYVKSGVNTECIGVMAPYRAQVSLLTQAIKAEPKLAEIEVNTIDQFQGKDKEVIVYSCTRSDGASRTQAKEQEILNDRRRLTVAITRAKHKLVLIGHSETLKLYTPFKKLLMCMSKSNIIPADL